MPNYPKFKFKKTKTPQPNTQWMKVKLKDGIHVSSVSAPGCFWIQSGSISPLKCGAKVLGCPSQGQNPNFP